MASIAGWEGSQTRDFCGLAAAKAADNVRHEVIELISSGSGRNAGCPGKAADKGGLFHGTFMLAGV